MDWRQAGKYVRPEARQKMHWAGNNQAYALWPEVHAPRCGKGYRQEVEMSGRRQTHCALDKEADTSGLWTMRWMCRAMDNKEADAPGQRHMLPAVDKNVGGRRTHQDRG